MSWATWMPPEPAGSGAHSPRSSDDPGQVAKRPAKSIYSVAANHPWRLSGWTLVEKSTFGTRPGSPSNDDDMWLSSKVLAGYDVRDEALANIIQEAMVKLGYSSASKTSSDKIVEESQMEDLANLAIPKNVVPCLPHDIAETPSVSAFTL
jgi:hypothetical protein